MKKFLLFTLLTIFFIGIANADKVVSKSRHITIIKEKSGPKPWYISIKGGGGVVGHEYGCSGLYDVEVGFSKYFHSKPAGAFWGVQLGSTMCGVRWSGRSGESNKFGADMKPGIYAGASIGFSNNLNNDVCFTFNMSANLLTVFASGYCIDPEQSIGGNFKLQPGFWISRFYAGLDGVFEFSGASVHCGGALLKIGYRF